MSGHCHLFKPILGLQYNSKFSSNSYFAHHLNSSANGFGPGSLPGTVPFLFLPRAYGIVCKDQKVYRLLRSMPIPLSLKVRMFSHFLFTCYFNNWLDLGLTVIIKALQFLRSVKLLCSKSIKVYLYLCPKLHRYA